MIMQGTQLQVDIPRYVYIITDFMIDVGMSTNCFFILVCVPFCAVTCIYQWRSPIGLNSRLFGNTLFTVGELKKHTGKVTSS